MAFDFRDNWLYRAFDNFFSKDEYSEISRLKAEKESLKGMFDSAINTQRGIQSAFDASMKRVGELEEELARINNIAEATSIKPASVPAADISYRRPVYIGDGIGDGNVEEVEVDVRLFCKPDFGIENSVKAAKLTYNGKQDLDILIPKLYQLAKKDYKYGFDTQYGLSEYVMFPYELRHMRSKGRSGDCDDWANIIAAHFSAARIPRNKWLVSYGYTRNDGGHATVYCKDSTGIWHHLNSTTPHYKHASLKEFPSNKDETDKIGIKPNGFWFSFNDIFALQKFESDEAASSFKENFGDVIKFR